MADHEVVVELFYDGAWQPVAAYTRDGIALSRGAGGEGQQSPPSTAGLTLADPDGELSPLNVNGPLYGQVGRNTPLRVSADGSIRSTTEISGWGLDRELATGVDAWIKVEGGGILRRLQQGKTPLLSALEREIRAAAPHAFWPLTDGKDASVLLAGVPGVEALAINGARPGEVAGPAGSSQSFLDVASEGPPVSARGPIPPGLPAAGWGLEFLVFIGRATVPGATPGLEVLRWSVSGSDEWRVEIGIDSSQGPYVIIFGDIGTTAGGVFRTDDVSYGWHHVRLTMEQVGGNVVQTLWLDGTNRGTTDLETTAGTLGPPTGDLIIGQVSALVFDEYLEQAGVGMVAFWPLADAIDRSAAASGYAGELAAARFERVLAEVGITAVIVGDPDDTQPMGPEPTDTRVNILRECATTDDGIMFEPRDQRAVALRTGRSMRNQDPAAELSFLDGFAPGFVPVLDDQNTRNDVTATRRGGGSARAVRETGPLNAQDPVDDPDGVGRYDTSIQVNPVSDDALANHAHWHLAKGTVEGPRFPVVRLDLDASPALAAVVDPLEIGDRFTVDDLPDVWSIDPASLVLLGVKESFPAGGGDYRRVVTLVAAPAAPYEVLLVGASDGSVDLRGQRVGTELSTVDGAHTEGDTTILIDSAGIEWTTNPDDLDPALNGGGLFLTFAGVGEVVRVTAVAGAGSSWTLTVVRAVNGVSKAIPDGAAVRFLYPGRLGL